MKIHYELAFKLGLEAAKRTGKFPSLLDTVKHTVSSEINALQSYIKTYNTESYSSSFLCAKTDIPVNTELVQAEIMQLGCEVLNKKFFTTLEEYDNYIRVQSQHTDWHLYHEDFVTHNSAGLAESWKQGHDWKINYLSPGMRMRRIISDRSAPYCITKDRTRPQPTIDLREITARQTLRSLVSSRDYHLFLHKGFISVVGRSGRRYNISSGSILTTVYENNELTEKLCVILKGQFCPTDMLIMRYILILHDEDEFRKIANIVKIHPYNHRLYSKIAINELRQRSLPDLFRSLKEMEA